jgi:hypothetical protein
MSTATRADVAALALADAAALARRSASSTFDAP